MQLYDMCDTLLHCKLSSKLLRKQETRKRKIRKGKQELKGKQEVENKKEENKN